MYYATDFSTSWKLHLCKSYLLFCYYSYKFVLTVFIFTGIYFLLTALIRDVAKMNVRLTSVEKRLGGLEEILRRGGNHLQAPDRNFPIFNTMEEYKNETNHPKDMVFGMPFLTKH